MKKEEIYKIIEWVGKKTTVQGYTKKVINFLTDECFEAIPDDWKQANEAERSSDKCHIQNVSNRRELLCAFFKFFRDNGEANIGMTIEQFVDAFLNTQ